MYYLRTHWESPGLFTVTGIGLIPTRVLDTYRKSPSDSLLTTVLTRMTTSQAYIKSGTTREKPGGYDGKQAFRSCMTSTTYRIRCMIRTMCMSCQKRSKTIFTNVSAAFFLITLQFYYYSFR